MTDRRVARGRRELAAAVVGCVLGGALVLWGVGRGWLTISAPRPHPLPPLQRTVTGRAVDPLVAAMAVVALAGGIAMLATRRVGRLLVALLLTGSGVVVVVRSIPSLGGVSTSRAAALLTDHGSIVGVPAGAAFSTSAHPGWIGLSIAGGVLVAAAGLLALARAARWPAMGRRYDAPTAAAPSRPAEPSTERAHRELWDALDRGDDPTPPAVDASAAGEHAAGDVAATGRGSPTDAVNHGGSDPDGSAAG